MPIPPRPTPSQRNTATPRHNARRPGSSVPRKAMATAVAAAQHRDWRAEVAVLGDLNLASTVQQQQHHARSAPLLLGISPGSGPGSPASSGSGLRIVERMREAKQQKEREEQQQPRHEEETAAPKHMEVGLEGLIEQSRGKREKRATTATTLGFDFVPNPAVVALPETPATAPLAAVVACDAAAAVPPDTSALLSTSRDMKVRAEHLWGGRPSPTTATDAGASLPRTPCTPALLPASTAAAGLRRDSAAADPDSDSDESDWDWEHVSDELAPGGVLAAPRDDDDDADGIMIGEMDLGEEDYPDVEIPSLSAKVKPKERKILSYAAALGRSGAKTLDRL